MPVFIDFFAYNGRNADLMLFNSRKTQENQVFQRILEKILKKLKFMIDMGINVLYNHYSTTKQARMGTAVPGHSQDKEVTHMNTVIKKIQARDEKFVIVRDEEGWYLAINTKYIDADGKLNRQLNGLQMFANKELKQTVRTVLMSVEVDYLMSTGMTDTEAVLEAVRRGF